ncbi:hypothetical protein MIZ01_0829 [Sideroxyarcus emersonii]|uniref:DUF6129 domain-containing protein n=1 Tax=Sideroxyarcus emersonii TaxID=2764705 RepID=A0AAN1X9G9_9PROT|nr:DUF6129 family protein [Sideroxyarcus emersonii]BCK87059.1 hypothetical protein MIZ01_0829 [Sideroxyarcus emersonii]
MIVPETLSRIASAAAAFGELNDDALASLKQTWPDLRFTLCSDEDMPARLPPALRREGFNLYLINGSEHCLSLTDDPAQAIGVVLAYVDE